MSQDKSSKIERLEVPSSPGQSRDDRGPEIAGADEGRSGPKAGRSAALEDVKAWFDQHLAQLQAPDTRERMEAVMASCGRTRTRPKAGPSF